MARMGSGRRGERPFFRQAWKLASISSTPPICIRWARARRSLAAPSRNSRKRGQVVVATKVFHPMRDKSRTRQGLSRKHIMHAIDNSLRRLGMDYVDLYQIHRFDPQTPIEETIEALHDVVKAGKALYVGASSMYAWQFARISVAGGRDGLDALCLHAEPLQSGLSRGRAGNDAPVPGQGIAVIPWSPLARGPRRQSQKEDPESGTTDRPAERWSTIVPRRTRSSLAVEDIATSRGVPPPQVALAWLMSRPGIAAPIIGASRPAASRRGGCEPIACLDLRGSHPARSALPATPCRKSRIGCARKAL